MNKGKNKGGISPNVSLWRPYKVMHRSSCEIGPWLVKKNVLFDQATLLKATILELLLFKKKKNYPASSASSLAVAKVEITTHVIWIVVLFFSDIFQYNPISVGQS